MDGLRGIAVLLMISIHVGLLASGYIGVDMSFALSGFLITQQLGDRACAEARLGPRRAGSAIPAAWLAAMLIISLLGHQAPRAGSAQPQAPPRPGVLKRAIGSRPLTYTGRISYEIYR